MEEIASKISSLLSKVYLSIRKPKTSNGGQESVQIVNEWTENVQQPRTGGCILADAKYLHHSHKNCGYSDSDRARENQIIRELLETNHAHIRYVDYPNSSGRLRDHFERMPNTTVDVVEPEEYAADWLIQKMGCLDDLNITVIGKISHLGIQKVVAAYPEANITVLVHESDRNLEHETSLFQWGCLD